MIAFRQFWRRSSGGAFCYPARATLLTVALTFSLAAVLTVAFMAGGWNASYAGEPGQVAASNLKQYSLAGDTWPILDLSAPLPGYAFAQVQDSTPPTFVSSGLDIVTRALSITFSETIDATSVDPTKIHIRESGNYTGGITLTAGELDTAADGNAILFILTPSHSAAVAVLAAPELTIDPGAVRDASGNTIASTFGVSAASITRAFSVASQDLFPRDVTFSNDGAKMFVVGNGADNVNEYTLSTPFDVSAASITHTFSVASRDAYPSGVAFSNDGTKMFVVGYQRNNVNEYTLSTPFDVSSAVYTTYFSVRLQDKYTTDLAFSNDGTKMFVVGYQKDNVNEYTLSAPFDISTASITHTFSVASQESSPQDVAFSNDGTKMFVVGSGADNVNEYTLSAPFDVSTAYFVDAFSVVSQDRYPSGVAFSNDGTKMFVVGSSGDKVNEYALRSVYPITVASTFVTTWETTTPDESITIPATGTYTIDWGDGTVNPSVTGTQTHTYVSAGNHTVYILGGLQSISLADDPANAAKLQSIDRWGDMGWTTMEGAFQGAANMTYSATDAPDLSRVTDMDSMFRGAAAFNGDLSGWNVSSVTDMRSMFNGAAAFNGDLSGWNVSSVTDMRSMFNGAAAFNGDLSGWNVSSVTDMRSMFNGAAAFNGDLSGWNVSSVTDMRSMFNGAAAFNGDLSGWNVSSVTGMKEMFVDTLTFNQPIISWDVSHVTDMTGMFTGADRFVQNLGEWYVVLDDTAISDMTGTLAIRAQNDVLDGQNPTYALGSNEDSDLFVITGSSLGLKPSEDYSAKTSYGVNITSTGSFGTNNWRMVDVTVAGIDSAAPTFVSSELDSTTGILEITFSETIDATPKARVVPEKIHLRESGNYTGGITLTAAELLTAVDGATISFALNAAHRAAVAELTVPELTVDPWAVRDRYGNLIASTLDISTVSHVYASSVIESNRQTGDVEFSNDGLRMFTVDPVHHNVNEYALFDAFDLAAGSYFADSFSVESQMKKPFAMAFSNDGTKMFVVGVTRDFEQESIDSTLSGNPIDFAPTASGKAWAVGEYTLSDAFDVSTASYVDSIPVSEPADFTLLMGLTFSNDGTKMFVVGSATNDIYTYTLSTAFDLSTASYDDAYSILFFGADLRDMAFSNDGTQLFIIDAYFDYVFKRTLPTAFDLSTTRYAGYFPVPPQETSPRGLALSDDGSKIFVIGNTVRNVDEYTLSSVYPVTLINSVAPVEDHFVTTWRTGADNETVTIPVYSGLTYYYTVVWGDGSTDTGVTGDASHTYAVAGDYQVRIYGTFPGIHLDGHGDADKLALIDQWGSHRWASMESAFKGASLMTYAATDAPDLSGVTDMSHMFANASRFNGDISSWNVSQVTDMSYMFSAASDFDQPLNGWDVSAVTTMSNMFSSADVFDRPLNGWDVSSVTDMSNMFYSAFAFNQSLNNWNVSDVTDMTDMFHTRLYQNLGSWYVVANATSIARNYVPGVVAEFSAQNAQLDGHSPTYGKGTGGDWEYFEITGSEGNLLSVTSAAAKDTYYVNVTASGSSIFGNSNSWHTVKITVIDDAISPIPDLTTDAVMPTDDDSVRVSVDFGEAINAATFAVSDVSVTGGTASDLTHLSDNRTFAFTLTPDTAGQVTVSIPAGSITDLAGNANAISNTLTDNHCTGP